MQHPTHASTRMLIYLRFGIYIQITY